MEGVRGPLMLWSNNKFTTGSYRYSFSRQTYCDIFLQMRTYMHGVGLPTACDTISKNCPCKLMQRFIKNAINLVG
jgi:hypothetical protein